MPLPAPVINATLPCFVSVLTAFSLFAGRRIVRVRAHTLSHHTTADCSSQTPWLPGFPPCAWMVEVRDVPVTWRHVASRDGIALRPQNTGRIADRWHGEAEQPSVVSLSVILPGDSPATF